MRELHGESISPGVGRGEAHPVDLGSPVPASRPGDAVVADRELRRLEVAIARASQDLEQTGRRLAWRIGDGDAAILLGHVALMQDPDLRVAMEEQIRAGGQTAEAAVATTLETLRARLAGASDSITRDRADDIADIKRRLLHRLSHSAPPEVMRGSVIVCEMLTPSELVHYAHEGVSTFVVRRCAPRSHTAILARSLAVALVAGIQIEAVPAGSDLLVLGEAGLVIVEPEPAQVASFEAELDRQRAAVLPVEAAALQDGTPVTLLMNISDPLEVEVGVPPGGIGLFRTEFLYMVRDGWPSAAESEQAYRRVLEVAHGREVHIRLADFGGDKSPPYAEIVYSRNPSLSLRGVRWLLEHEEVLAAQVRALAAVAPGHQLVVLLPMVDTVDTLDQLLATMRDLLGLASEAPFPFTVGAMIEVPSAAVQARAIMARVDSISVGLNDLTQYLLAADRDDTALQGYHDPLQPAVLRTVDELLAAAEQLGRPVTMCGELAGSTRLAVALLALGARRFSVARVQLAGLADLVSRLAPPALRNLRAALRTAETGAAVRELIAGWEASVTTPG